MPNQPDYLPESRAYFLKFKEANIRDYRDALREYQNPVRSGYPRYVNDEKIATYFNNLMGNFDEGLEDVAIPEKFSSPDRLIDSWTALYNFALNKKGLFEETAAKLKKDNQRSDVFGHISEIHLDIIGCLKTILNMEEVKDRDAKNTAAQVTQSSNDHLDIAIITALHDTEFEAFQRLLPEFKEGDSTDPTQYLFGTIGNKKIVIATDDKMGMSAATALTIKMLAKFKPAQVIMGGIAAGVKSEDRNFGDILVARYTYNYESGKYQFKQKNKQTVFEPNPEQIELDTFYTAIINRLKGDKSFKISVSDSFEPTLEKKRPDYDLSVHFGPIASGSAVLADDKKVEEIRAHSRKLIGIDMETFGVYYGCKSFASIHKAHPISIKSISDFADKRKTDGYRDYAAHTSASFIIEMIKRLP